MSLPQAIDGMDKLKLCCLLIFGLVICLKEVGGAKTCEIDSVLCYSDLSEPNDPPVFHDLTRKEMKSVQTYLYQQPDLRLLLPDQAQINNSFIQGMELYLPNKKDVLQYLNANVPTPQPPRAAVVTIFRGDCDPAKVEEYIVFPLPWPTQHRLHRTIPYYLRPFNDKEFASISDFLNKEVDGTLGHFLQESFGGRLLNCGKRCLGFQLASPVGPSVSNEPGARKSWYWLHQVVEYSILHPVDFSVLMKIVGCVYYIEKVYFNNLYFNSLQELALHYRNPSFPRLKIPYPIESKQLFSKMERRGVLFPEKPVSPPRQVEPEGKRYSVKYQEVKYMNWKFNFRLSPGLGPRLHNIRYLDRMIVYELALQDIVVFYSGAEPPHQYANFFDSSYLIGMNLQGMVPGVDCPTGATFIDSYVMTESSIKPAKLINAFCVFEQNTGDFLRRHISKAAPDGPFYEGSPSIVLVFRAITTIANYDYTIDFIFHQNGVLQTKVVPTGYILPSLYTKENENKYGFRLNHKLIGNLHHHLFNFKVDVDINGQCNRYETLDIVLDKTSHPVSKKPYDVWYQNKIKHHLRKTELDALFKYDFDQPMHHIFYNNKVKSPEGNNMAYRLVNRGMSKSLLPECTGNEGTGAWMRHQITVTKRKETELTSSSIYSALGTKEPVVNFKNFYADNENIVDEDLVAWVTMGTYHIPHTEDLPVTHTPGLDLSFFLSPFNYFPEDPGMGSRDSVRIEALDKYNLKRGIRIDKQTFPEKMTCKAPIGNYFEYILKRPSVIFDIH